MTRHAMPLRALLALACASSAVVFTTQARAAAPSVDAALREVEPRVVEWRRDFHRNPELSNREFRTSKAVAEHLRSLGLEVQTGIAHTGVVALLKGGRPGPTLALRADMDALPVVEKTDVPFRSTVTTTYRGETVGVMHACGHDAHTAVLMGVAQVLTRLRGSLAGNVLFIFQPAEEGAPEGEEGGAELMLKEGIFDRYRPEAAVGLHVWSGLHTGEIAYRGGPFMAAADAFRIQVKGRQSHGSRPWQGLDPIVVSAQIVNALQTIVSRQVDITENPAIVSIGAIKGGIRNNIIADSVEMVGTLRTFTLEQRADIMERVKRIVENTAAASGTTATFELTTNGVPVTTNDPALMSRLLPTLRRVAGEKNIKAIPLVTGAEDFAYYGRKVPSLFYFIGVTPPDRDLLRTPTNHSDYFYVDEHALPLAVRSLTEVALDYLRP